MKSDDIEKLVDTMKNENQNFPAEDFPSADAFKSEFLQNANALPPVKRTNWKTWGIAASVIMVGVVVLGGYEMFSDASMLKESSQAHSPTPTPSTPNAPNPTPIAPAKYTPAPNVVPVETPAPSTPRQVEFVQSVAFDCMVAPACMPPGCMESVMNTESYAAVQETGFKDVLKEPLSTFSSDVDVAGYTIVRNAINNGYMPDTSFIRIEEFLNAFKYNYPKPTGDAPVAISTEISVCPWNMEHHLARVAVQAKSVATDKLPPSNIVFLLDVSGSMYDENKLPLVKKSVELMLTKMRPEDRIAVVTYACGASVPLPSTSAKNVDKIMKVINNLQAGGSTNGAGGIDLAYKIARENFIKDGNNRVIIATDGDFNVGTTSHAALLSLIAKQRESGVYLTVLGFGMGNYKDDTLELLADKGNGNYAYIDNILEAKRTLMTEFASTLWTVAKDVKLQVEFNPKKVQSYRLIGYENRRLNNEDFANDKKDAGDMGAEHAVTALYELTMVKENATIASSSTRYTETKVTSAADQNEIMTVNMRYKTPDSDTSRLISVPVENVQRAFEKTSDDFRFAAALAAFGQVLRNSEFKGTMTLDYCEQLAKGAKGADESCERAEFIRLIEKAKLIKP